MRTGTNLPLHLGATLLSPNKTTIIYSQLNMYPIGYQHTMESYQAIGGSGLLQRKFPSGARANGMPRKCFNPVQKSSVPSTGLVEVGEVVRG